MTELTDWPVGGLWEDKGLHVDRDVEMSRLVGGSIFAHYGKNEPGPCPHGEHVTREPARDGTIDCERESWIVPRVLVASNEAGHATTGVCLDCVVDFAAALKGTTS